MNLSIAAWQPRARFEFRNASLEIVGFVQLLDRISQAQSIFPSILHAHSFDRVAPHVWQPRSRSKPMEEVALVSLIE